MSSANLDKYFTWLPVVNTAEDRYHKESSSTHDILCNNKIRESTKQLNKYLRTHRPKNYSDFVKCKKNILSIITNNVDVTNDYNFTVKDCKTFYDSFDVTSARNSEAVPDDLFVWSFVEKKGLKKESNDAQKDSIWEPKIDINVDDSHGQCDRENRYNVSLKAAGALLIKKEKLHKKCVEEICNTRSSSSCKNFENTNTSCTDVPTETPTNVVEKTNYSDTTVLRYKKLKNVKRNLRSAIDHVSLQVSETSEANLSSEFIPEDFQAQSTQIFSDTFTDGSVLKSSRRTRQAHKFPSNDAINQPKDSGIEEDSRDENTKYENITHQNIYNEKDNILLKKSDRKILGVSKNKDEDSFASENVESRNTPQKKCLKIIGDETLTKKYKIVAKDDRALQPIVEEKPFPSSELNDENDSPSKSDSDKNSESDFKPIESDNKEESNGAEKTRESSDQYHDVHDENNALSSEDEKFSPAEKNVVKNRKVQIDQDSDSQDSRHHHRRIKNQLKKSTSPWISKQYNDLKRLRLLESSEDDSEVESHKKDESANIAKQKVSIKSKKTSKKSTNEIETSSNKSNTKSNKKKLFITGKLIKNSDEMNDSEISNENFDDDRIIDVNTKKEKSVENSDHLNSKLDSDNREYSEYNTTDSHKSLQKVKKLKQRKKRQTSNRTDSLSSREHSYERQTQHNLNGIVKSYEDLSQSIKDDDSNENIHESFEEDDVPVLHAEKSTEQKTKSDYNSEDSEKDVDALCSKNNISSKDSSALSIIDIVKSKLVKESGLKNEIFTSSDDEKDSEDEKTMSENQQKQLQNFKKMDLIASDESSDTKMESEIVDLQNKNESPRHKNEKSSRNIEKSSESDDEADNLETKETVLPYKESQSDKSDQEDEGLPTLHAQKKLQQMKRLTFDGSSASEDSETDIVSINKHKSQFIKSEFAKEQNFKDKSERVNGACSDETSNNEDTMSENQNKQLLNLKKKKPMASDESSVSESEHEIVDSQSKQKLSCHINERTNKKVIAKLYESNDYRTDGREMKELILPQKESPSDESDKEDEGLPTLHAQKKLQQMKRLTFDGSSESEDSETDIVSVNKHKSQFIKSETAKKQIFKEKSGEHRVSSDEKSDEEDIMSKNQKNHLQQMKKMNYMASDESSVSETEHESVNSQSKQKLSCHRNDERTHEKIIGKFCESNGKVTDGPVTKELILPRKESQSDESDKEDEGLPTLRAQKKLQQMKRLTFDGSSESEDSETDIVSVNKHKSQFIKSETAKKQIFKEKFGEHRANSDEESDEKDIMSENQKNHLHQMKKMDLMASNESDDSDEKDQISKSLSKKLPNEEIKSEDSEDDDKASDATVRQEKNKLHKKSRNADSNKGSDSDSVHYDSDNIDIKEHKVILPGDLKNTHLSDHFNESNIASFSISKNLGKTETFFDRKEENDEDEEIDNIVPVEVSKRMQQLKRLNLYENDDSSDSDESLKNKRNNGSNSQKSFNLSKKERDDSSSDEKESVNKELPVSTSKPNESELNESKEDVQDNVIDEKELEIAVGEKNRNVIIPETQESEYLISDNNQTQEMFSSLEDLSKNPSRISPTPQPVSKQPTPTKPNREKITQIKELVEQEELMKTDLEPTMTLDDVSDDEDIFVIEVPKSVFDQELTGKKLVVTKSTLSIGDSHYEAVKKNTSPIMSCVLNSKRNKFKIVNIRPLLSIAARRKKNADDFIENPEIENRHKNLKAMNNQRPIKESDQESVNEAHDIEPTSTKSKLKKQKSSQIDKPLTLSSATSEESKHSKKKSAKSKKNNLNNFIGDVEISEEKTRQDKAKTSKAFKRKLYASDRELKDVDNNATDDSFINANNSFKKPKISKKEPDTRAKSVKRVIRSELTLNNLNKENEIVSAPKHENDNELEITDQNKPKTKVKKKSNNTATHQKTEEESQLKKVTNSIEDDKEMFENMFRESFLINVSMVEEEQPVKKKAKKRKNASEDVNSEAKVKSKKKSKAEEVEDNPITLAKPKRTRRKFEKPKEEPASVQIMKFINDAFKSNNKKLNSSTSSNESRYGALDIERVSTKKNYSSSSSSDESEKKYSRPTFQIRDKSKEKELVNPSTSSCSTTLKKEVKDDKKKIKKIHFDE